MLTGQTLSNRRAAGPQSRNVCDAVYFCTRPRGELRMNVAAAGCPPWMVLWRVWRLSQSRGVLEANSAEERRGVCGGARVAINHGRQQINGPQGLASNAGFPGGRFLHCAEEPSCPQFFRHAPARPQTRKTNEEEREEGRAEREEKETCQHYWAL